MLQKLQYPNKHPYQEALHTLLYEYPQGLSAIDIADQLNISDVQCAALLKSEQIRDALDADPYSGTLIYKSKRETQPQFSLSTAIAKGQRNQSRKIMKMIGLSCSFLAGITLIASQLPNISINIVTSDNDSWSRKSNWSSKVDYRLARSSMEQELIKRKKLQLISEREDLNARINQMRDAVIDENCRSYWRNNQYCYVEGRLLNRSDFYQELRWIKSEIKKINRQYRLVGR